MLTNGKLGRSDGSCILQMKDMSMADHYPSMIVVLCNSGNVLLKGQQRGQNTWEILAFSLTYEDC